MLIRLVILVIILVFLFAVVQMVADIVRAVAARRRRGVPGGTTVSASGQDHPSASLSRPRTGGPEVGEDRAGILRFLESHHGVEAYVEPEALLAPRSIVLVDGDGVWSRSELPDDGPLGALADRGIPIYDATRLGYPKRMRQRRQGRGGDAAGP